MNLESKLLSSEEETADLFCGALGVTAAYNLAGLVCENIRNEESELFLTSALLTAGGILGYKARNFFNRKNREVRRKIKRVKARNKTLAEIAQDEDFLERQGIAKGTFSKTRRVINYALTVPFGGALGCLPGATGIIPLCVYFGKNYEWSESAALDSGKIAGPALASWAFAEMTAKRNSKKLATTAGALAGVNLSYYLAARMNLRVLDSKPDLWLFLGMSALGAIAGGITARKIYRITKKVNETDYYCD